VAQAAARSRDAASAAANTAKQDRRVSFLVKRLANPAMIAIAL
jgi:hypothetical protein